MSQQSPTSENRRSHWWRVLLPGQKKILFLAGVVLVFLVLVLGVLISYDVRAEGYDLDKVVSSEPLTAVYGYEDEYLSTLVNVRYEPVEWQHLPQNLINAFVAREDEDFFKHRGIVYSAILRSVLRNLSTMRYQQGASTITMQLTRNVFELQNKTMDRKILEAFIARRVEDRYDKKTILTRYLNRIFFGHSCYGIGAAARYYFGKHVSRLNLSECAVLAGLVRGPSIFNPRTSMASAEIVKRETLERMLSLQFITQDEYDAAMATPIELAEHVDMENRVQTYMSQWVSREMTDVADLSDEKNVGMAIVTTFDLPLQQYVEEAAERALMAVEHRSAHYYPTAWHEESETPEALASAIKFFTDTKRPADFKTRGDSNDFKDLLQCCVLVVDGRKNHAGEVLAAISGRGVSDGIDRWQGTMQPGRNAAPFLFCATCSRKSAPSYIQTQDVITTGDKTGYEAVAELYHSMLPDLELPEPEQAHDLYEGKFSIRRLDFARILFALQNSGRGYDFYSVLSAWSRGRQQLYSNVRNRQEDYIKREYADTVCEISPFVVKNKLVLLSEKLPGNGGVWSMACNRLGVAVYVWMGFDDPTRPCASSSSLNALMSRASIYLAKEIHRTARQRLKDRSVKK